MPRHLHISLHDVRSLLERSGVAAHPQLTAGVAAGVVLSGMTAWWVVRSRRPTAEEQERRRRLWLAQSGRLTDGSIVDARSLRGENSLGAVPEVLVYQYRIAGVRYECAQDVSQLPGRRAGYRLDEPVQVRYDPRNPGNSIIVSEDWTGLRWPAGTAKTKMGAQTNAGHAAEAATRDVDAGAESRPR